MSKIQQSNIIKKGKIIDNYLVNFPQFLDKKKDAIYKLVIGQNVTCFVINVTAKKIVDDVEVDNLPFTIRLPYYDFEEEHAQYISWGDDSELRTDRSNFLTHTYEKAGMYQIYILGDTPNLYSIEYMDPATVTPELKNFQSCLYEIRKLSDSLTNLNAIFKNYKQLTAIPDEPLPAHAKNCNQLFADCWRLEYLPANFRLPQDGVSFSKMFYDCLNLKHILNQNLALPYGTKNVDFMFSHTPIQTFPENFFNNVTSSLTSLEYMFSWCKKLLDFKSNVSLPYIENISHMFEGCEKVRTIKLDVPEVKYLTVACAGCSALVDIQGVKINQTTLAATYAFNECVSLQSNISALLDCNEKFTLPLNHTFYNCKMIEGVPKEQYLWKSYRLTNQDFYYVLTSAPNGWASAGLNEQKIFVTSLPSTTLYSPDLSKYPIKECSLYKDQYSNVYNYYSIYEKSDYYRQDGEVEWKYIGLEWQLAGNNILLLSATPSSFPFTPNLRQYKCKPCQVFKNIDDDTYICYQTVGNKFYYKQDGNIVWDYIGRKDAYVNEVSNINFEIVKQTTPFTPWPGVASYPIKDCYLYKDNSNKYYVCYEDGEVRFYYIEDETNDLGWTYVDKQDGDSNQISKNLNGIVITIPYTPGGTGREEQDCPVYKDINNNLYICYEAECKYYYKLSPSVQWITVDVTTLSPVQKTILYTPHPGVARYPKKDCLLYKNEDGIRCNCYEGDGLKYYYIEDEEADTGWRYIGHDYQVNLSLYQVIQQTIPYTPDKIYYPQQECLVYKDQYNNLYNCYETSGNKFYYKTNLNEYWDQITTPIIPVTITTETVNFAPNSYYTVKECVISTDMSGNKWLCYSTSNNNTPHTFDHCSHLTNYNFITSGWGGPDDTNYWYGSYEIEIKEAGDIYCLPLFKFAKGDGKSEVNQNYDAFELHRGMLNHYDFHVNYGDGTAWENVAIEEGLFFSDLWCNDKNSMFYGYPKTYLINFNGEASPNNNLTDRQMAYNNLTHEFFNYVYRSITHIYQEPGKYKIILMGRVPRFFIHQRDLMTNRHLVNLITINKLPFTTLDHAFTNAFNLRHLPNEQLIEFPILDAPGNWTLNDETQNITVDELTHSDIFHTIPAKETRYCFATIAGKQDYIVRTYNDLFRINRNQTTFLNRQNIK